MLLRIAKNQSYYVWITVLGILLRVVWSLSVPVIPTSDSNAYDTFAQNIVNCQTYGWECNSPTAFWPVGTSFTYSVLYYIFGHQYLPIIILNLLLACVTIVLSIYLAEQWFGRRVGAITGLLLAIWPSQIQFTTVLASEQLFTALSVAALFLWSYDRINLWLRAVIVGIVLAATTYVRPTAILIPALLLFLRYVSTREIVKSVTATLIVFAMMAMLIAPWTIRNAQVFGQFVLVSTNGGSNLWMGNNPASTGQYMELPPETQEMNEAERDKYLKSIAVAHIKEKPLLFATRVLQRTIDTHSRESIGVAWNEEGLMSRYGKWAIALLKIINQLYWMSVLGLALVGIILLGIEHGWIAMLTHPTVLFWGYFTAIHAVIVAQDRYHFPSIPMIAVLAAFTLIYLLDLTLKSRQKAKEKIS